MPREIQRENAAHAEIPEENFALFGVNTLPAADKLRAAGAAQPRETADGFRVGLERAENGREGDHLVSQRTEKARSAAGRNDHAVRQKTSRPVRAVRVKPWSCGAMAAISAEQRSATPSASQPRRSTSSTEAAVSLRG